MSTTASPRTAPFGWRVNKAGKKVEDRAQSRVIARIFHMASAGHNWSAIAETLNEKGAKTKRGGEWRGQTVSAIAEREADRAAVLMTRYPEHDVASSGPPSSHGILAEIDEQEKREGCWLTEEHVDHRTGKVTHKDVWFSPADLKEIEATKIAIERLSALELSEDIHIGNPIFMDGAQYAVERMFDPVAKELHAIVEKIEHQAQAKREARETVKRTLKMLTEERQENLHLRQEIEALRADRRRPRT